MSDVTQLIQILRNYDQYHNSDVDRAADMLEKMSETIATVLRNIVSSVAKEHDAPASAATHLELAIADLARATDWRPDNAELRDIIENAIATTVAFRGEP